MTRRAISSAVFFVSVFAMTCPALAQDKSPQRGSKAQANVLQIGEITIVGRVQKPIAAVDVAKLQPKLTLSELTKSFVLRIETATNKDPF
jgi:hypothetical protein